MLCTFNLYSAICQLYLNKTGRKKDSCDYTGPTCTIQDHFPVSKAILSLFFGCTILHVEFPQPGIETVPPAVEVWSLNHATAREVLKVSLLIISIKPLLPCNVQYLASGVLGCEPLWGPSSWLSQPEKWWPLCHLSFQCIPRSIIRKSQIFNGEIEITWHQY